jgi:hypothetical protein
MKTYSTIKQSLDELPLATLSRDFDELATRNLDKYNWSYKELLDKAKQQFLANNTDYTGSFEELNLDWQVRASLGNLPALDYSFQLENFAKIFAIPKNADWFFAQTISKFGQLPLVKNERGYSAKTLYLEHIKNNPPLKALWLLLRHPKRSVLLEKQTDLKFRNYSSLVPIIMSAFKRFNNIQYSEWDPTEIFGITDSNLSSAMLFKDIPDFSRQELLEKRGEALLIKSGTKAGEARNPVTTYSLYLNEESGLTKVPALARIMLFQCWCAHPLNRTQYMVLDPLNWDNIPEPLISTEVLLRKSDSTIEDNWAV